MTFHTDWLSTLQSQDWADACNRVWRFSPAPTVGKFQITFAAELFINLTLQFVSHSAVVSVPSACLPPLSYIVPHVICHMTRWINPNVLGTPYLQCPCSMPYSLRNWSIYHPGIWLTPGIWLSSGTIWTTPIPWSSVHFCPVLNWYYSPRNSIWIFENFFHVF